MPKELKPATSYVTSPIAVARPLRQSPTGSPGPHPARGVAVWSATDDEALMSARASGLNWAPIAAKHFPHKTANACRKRHERLMEKRNVDDEAWGGERWERLALAYSDCRKEMWSQVARRMLEGGFPPLPGPPAERWGVLEAKCMEKGLKTLLNTGRAAQKKANNAAMATNIDTTAGAQDRGMEEHEGDSGIGCSDAEMEAGDELGGPSSAATSFSHATASSLTPTSLFQPQQAPPPQPAAQRRVAPPPLPLYQPPAIYQTQTGAGPLHRRRTSHASLLPRESDLFALPGGEFARQQRYSPEGQSGRGGPSIQSLLSPAEVPQ
ncbi:hypothetical protein LTR66_004532 [Elasticomyces elasticus]|nr:hypothetical protein LTR66_004532 [Elasticomyces elasticus]